MRWISAEPLLGPVDLSRWVYDREEAISNAMNSPAAYNREQAESVVPRPLDWVVVGGESGPKARPMHPQWALDLRSQCAVAGVPLLLKQWGEWMPISQQTEELTNSLYVPNRKAKPHEDQRAIDELYGRRCKVKQTVQHLDGSLHHFLEPNAFPTGAMTTYRVGKKHAGRLLDGVLHDEYPVPAS